MFLCIIPLDQFLASWCLIVHLLVSGYFGFDNLFVCRFN